MQALYKIAKIGLEFRRGMSRIREKKRLFFSVYFAFVSMHFATSFYLVNLQIHLPSLKCATIKPKKYMIKFLQCSPK